jgi:hypothetical protein
VQVNRHLNSRAGGLANIDDKKVDLVVMVVKQAMGLVRVKRLQGLVPMTLQQPADEREEFELVIKNQNRFHCEPPLNSFYNPRLSCLITHSVRFSNLNCLLGSDPVDKSGTQVQYVVRPQLSYGPLVEKWNRKLPLTALRTEGKHNEREANNCGASQGTRAAGRSNSST